VCISDPDHLAGAGPLPWHRSAASSRAQAREACALHPGASPIEASVGSSRACLIWRSARRDASGPAAPASGPAGLRSSRVSHAARAERPFARATVRAGTSDPFPARRRASRWPGHGPRGTSQLPLPCCRQQRLGRVGKLPQHGLAPDDDDFAFIRYGRRRPKNVFKPGAIHSRSEWPDAPPR